VHKIRIGLQMRFEKIDATSRWTAIVGVSAAPCAKAGGTRQFREFRQYVRGMQAAPIDRRDGRIGRREPIATPARRFVFRMAA
jgi:hypothetical protein